MLPDAVVLLMILELAGSDDTGNIDRRGIVFAVVGQVRRGTRR